MSRSHLVDAADNFPEPFNIYAQILDGHLHFGYWPDDEPSLNLEKAQDTLFEMLVSHLPNPPARLLDVGCGLGKASYELAEMGYAVTSISPDKEMVEYAERMRSHPNLRYMVADFIGFAENHHQTGSFDAVLMQESLQYLRPLDRVFQAACHLLSDKGRIVLCDEIRLEASIAEMTAVHGLADIVVSAYDNFFYVKTRAMVGRHVRKTCDEVLYRLSELRQKIPDHFHDKAPVIDRLISGWNMQKQWYAQRIFDYALIVFIKNTLRIKVFTPGDENRLLPAFNRIFNVQRTMDHWIWKYRNNPHGKERIVLAEDKDKGLAAQYAGYPVIMHDASSQNGDYLVYQAGDTMTLPEFRNVGRGHTCLLARVLDCFCQKFCIDHIALMYGFNTDSIRKLGERYLGYEYIRPIPYHVLRVDQIPGCRGFGFFRELLGYSVTHVNSLDNEWDMFFERVGPDYNLLVKRDKKYLQWRYLDCPDSTHVLITIRKFGKLVGWSVFSQRNTVIIWGDGLFDKRHLSAVRILLQYVRDKVYPGSERFEAWFSPAPAWWSDTLLKLGFLSGQEPNDLSPGFMFFDSRFTKDFMDNNLYYTMGDSDLF